MKKSIKNLAVKEVKNVSAVKGGDGGGETTTLGDLAGFPPLPPRPRK